MHQDVKRREFLARMGSTIGGIGLASSAALASAGEQSAGQGTPERPSRPPTTTDIRNYLLTNSPWVNVKRTVETYANCC